MNDRMNQRAVEESGGDSQLVSALARGIRILQCFSMGVTELSGKELIERTGLPKPTALRLINTLCEFGLLRYSERLSKYVPGIEMLSMAAPVLGRMTIRQIARPLMQELADYCHGQVSLAAGFRFNMPYVEVVQGAGSSLFRPEAGMRLSLSRTATGRAYLSMMSKEERNTFVRSIEARDAEKAAWLKQRLTETCRDLTEQGFCISRGDMHREINSVAVPLRTPIDDEVWVFGCSNAVFNLSGNQLIEDIGPRLMSLVRRVEAALGNMTEAAHYMEEDTHDPHP